MNVKHCTYEVPIYFKKDNLKYDFYVFPFFHQLLVVRVHEIDIIGLQLTLFCPEKYVRRNYHASKLKKKEIMRVCNKL